MRHLLLALAAFAANAAWADDVPVDVYHVDNIGLAGRPQVVLEPRFPADALAQHVTGYVDVEGRVDPMGALKEIEYHAGSSQAEIFVAALKEVMPAWSFYPVYVDSCVPSDRRITVRIWFDLDADKPKVSATIASAPPQAREIRVSSCRQPRYPGGAIREGLTAIVYAGSEINADGTVAKVNTVVFPQGRNGNGAFSTAVEDALRVCRYPPAPDPDRHRLACHQVIFRLN